MGGVTVLGCGKVLAPPRATTVYATSLLATIGILAAMSGDGEVDVRADDELSAHGELRARAAS